MGMHIGIDVGGTFTDAVLINQSIICRKAKVPTETDSILETVLAALDALGSAKNLEHITVSTTLATNAILQNNLPPVELLLFPATGMNLNSFAWPIKYQSLSGQLDYRGREVSPPDELEWRRLLLKFAAEEVPAPSNVAIIGKFSHRNKIHEEALATFLKKHNPQLKIALGHKWGQANFYRRSLTTYLDLACTDLYNTFAGELQKAAWSKGFKAPISVLKADGGVLPLHKLRPVESIYSGPAASVLGALAQSDESQSFIVADIGGTTTDLGLVLSGKPLLSSRGAQIGAYSTLVRSMAVRSIAIGGDSTILPRENGFEIAAYRQGPASCMGGKYPTPTDAMCYLRLTEYGDYSKAEKGLAQLLPPCSRNTEQLHNLAEQILTHMVNKIAEAIEELILIWQEEPAYKVWEVLHPHELPQLHIWLSGGVASSLAVKFEQRLHTRVRIGKYPEATNAIGAALAKPTLSCTIHLDTYLRHYRIEETGEQGEWQGSKRPHQELDKFLEDITNRLAEAKGIKLENLEKEAFDFFPIVKGYETVGQIIRGSWHIPPGVRGRIRE